MPPAVAAAAPPSRHNNVRQTAWSVDLFASTIKSKLTSNNIYRQAKRPVVLFCGSPQRLRVSYDTHRTTKDERVAAGSRPSVKTGGLLSRKIEWSYHLRPITPAHGLHSFLLWGILRLVRFSQSINKGYSLSL